MAGVHAPFLLLVLGAYAVVTSGENTEGDATTAVVQDQVPTDVEPDPPPPEKSCGIRAEQLREENQLLAERVEAAVAEAVDTLKSALSQHTNTSAVNTVERLDNIQTSVEEISKRVTDFEANVLQRLTTIEESLQLCNQTENLNNVSEGLEQLSDTPERLSNIESKLPDIVTGVSTTVEELLKNTTWMMKHAISDAIGSLRNTLEPKVTLTRHFWYVENFSEFVRRATISSPTDVYSDIMVVAGYSSKINVQLKEFQEGLFLGLYFSLCPGENDSYLEWPFRIPYSLSIVHPKSSEQDLSRNFSMGTAKEEYAPCFSKPKKDCNSAYGHDALASVSTLESDGYVMDNAITVALTLYP
ncbi:uncharacterized protein LOC135378200 [Ornithodoros turicata]|uniref:uncharacterized protein LOC135378200 n=1 Tax=Ornithodoros turicata TaxID=34597 RepID=UPI00313A3057